MRRPETLEQLARFWPEVRPALAARAPAGQPIAATDNTPEGRDMLKKLPEKLGTGLHGSIPPARYWAYYTWQEIDAIAKPDRTPLR